jgi:hypothetical protein
MFFSDFVIHRGKCSPIPVTETCEVRCGKRRRKRWAQGCFMHEMSVKNISPKYIYHKNIRSRCSHSNVINVLARVVVAE